MIGLNKNYECLQILESITILRTYMVLGDTVCMDFEPCFKVYKLVSVHPKSFKLGQMTTLNVTSHVVVAVYRLVTVCNSHQFPMQFWNSLCVHNDAERINE